MDSKYIYLDIDYHQMVVVLLHFHTILNIDLLLFVLFTYKYIIPYLPKYIHFFCIIYSLLQTVYIVN